jgi:MarR family transcriptional regulator, organic hydroperoxide resistance regulator
MPTHSLTEILDAFRTLVHALQVGSRSSEERVGLTGAQLFVLEKLRNTVGMTVNELATATHTHQSTVSVVVSRLVEKELVSRVRSPMDARVQQLSITKKGISKLDRAPATVQEQLVSALKKLPTSERTQLALLLKHVLMNAGLSEIEPELFLETNEKRS